MEMTCHYCGESENLTPVTIGNETVYLCSDCRETHLKQCDQCGEYFLDDENDYVVDNRGDVYCEQCRDEYLSYCEHCGNFHDNDEFVHIADIDEYWCQDCADSDAYQCSHCGDYVAENCGDSDTYLCAGCFEDCYIRCDDCGELTHIDNSHSDDDGVYCEYCYNENHASPIHEYSYEPPLVFQKTSDDTEKVLPYLGFELESGGLSSFSRCKSVAEAISDDEDTFYLKCDGSIPEYGFELVSHPMTLKRHKEIDWEGTFRQMAESGLKSHDLGPEACGLHVHVSRNYLSSYRWLVIDWLVSKYQAQFEKIARRKETHWARYKKADGQPIKEIYGKASGCRYQAVNFENHNTVEFRLFRGTLNYNTFMATLEIVDALVHWTKQVSVHDIITQGDAFKCFVQFVAAHEDYTDAVNYLTEKNLM